MHSSRLIAGRTRFAVLAVLGMVAACLTLGSTPSLSAAEPNAKRDWTVLRYVPVFHNGRLMPLDTFARSAAEFVTDRQKPKLKLKEAVPSQDLTSKQYAEALLIFPNGDERKFDSVELLFSWMCEHERWEEVPFILAEHQELRQLLDVPVWDGELEGASADDITERGSPLKYVSPAQIRDADGLLMKLQEIQDKRRSAQADDKEYTPTDLEKMCEELFERFQFFVRITMSPAIDYHARGQFEEALPELIQAWVPVSRSFGALGMPADSGVGKSVKQIEGSIEQLYNLSQESSFNVYEADLHAGQAAAGAQMLADSLAQLTKKAQDEGAGAVVMERTQMLADSLQKVADEATALQVALHHNVAPLRVVPALNAAALERERDVADKAQPWLDLQTLVNAPDRVFEQQGYPLGYVKEVRSSFENLQDAVRDPSVGNFDTRAEQFATALNDLGQEINPLRDDLLIKMKDEDLIAYTEYPPAKADSRWDWWNPRVRINNEVLYNRVDPFMWSWVISLLGLWCFALAFGKMRKPMMWAGVTIMLSGIAWMIFGFALRVSVTKFAPVTNMYETVIYVATFVTALSLWFLLVPVLWPGLKKAWVLTGIPGTWETKEAVIEDAWYREMNVAKGVVLAARLALTVLIGYVLAVAPYSAGDRTILNLKPQSFSMNDLLVWSVSMIVFVPSCIYVPRVMISLILGVVMVPSNMRGQWSEALNQVYQRKAFAIAGAFVACVSALVAWWAPVLDSSFSPLQPVLRDNFWLTIHVLTIVSSYGAGALAWGLGMLSLGFYLFGKYRDPVKPSALAQEFAPAEESDEPKLVRRRPPEQCAVLANFIYRSVQVAVLLLAAGTILGGLWADVSWGRFWGWDPKEVWALISLLVYLAILHGRYAGLFGNFGLAFGAVAGASAIMFSWYGVNFVLGAGLHSYGFGAGGQAEVGVTVAVCWLFMMLAWARYWVETNTRKPATPTDSETERLQEEVLEASDHNAVEAGHADVEAGRTRPYREVLAELEK